MKSIHVKMVIKCNKVKVKAKVFTLNHHAPSSYFRFLLYNIEIYDLLIFLPSRRQIVPVLLCL